MTVKRDVGTSLLLPVLVHVLVLVPVLVVTPCHCLSIDSRSIRSRCSNGDGRHQNRCEGSATSRRQALRVVSSITGGVLTSSAVANPLQHPQPANAEPPNLPTPPMGGGPMMPPKVLYAEADEEWQRRQQGEQQIKTDLGSRRLTATQLNPLQQPPFGSQELYNAPFLFGSWEVETTLKRKLFPFGKGYVPFRSINEVYPGCISESIGDTSRYELHYFTTLANTAANQLTVNLGLGVPKTKVITDRSFNVESLTGAYEPLARLENIEWNYRDDPTRYTLFYSSIANDMRPMGKKRQEVYLSARTSETVEVDGIPAIFASSERSRHVALGQGTVSTLDVESITEYHKDVSDANGDIVSATQRLAIYLSPNPNSREGVLWQQVGGKAVAFYDYEMKMKRIKEAFTLTDGSTAYRACVRTPNDIIQCE
uniref:DUF6816 domain-containing protein n=1 Tax=Craspedostauros australis TaxID=1486917 RepID=A0A7S0F6T7_9STRA|mmetsp:Transcript_9222/g.24900  ORF Transcript_9222/g.24900 Transcript_9222/m.24900 type:complete len:425 (+) Transcript_9222:145-1419(+)